MVVSSSRSGERIRELTPADQLGVRRVTRRLVDEFADVYAPVVIEQFVSDFLDETVPNATVTSFLPLLAEHDVREWIRTRRAPTRTPR